jgi:hypothetical protein
MSLLREEATADQIATYLRRVRLDVMGLSLNHYNERADEVVARAIVRWHDEETSNN